jgi:hypothetical protein
LVILIILGIIIGVTYAYWITTTTQEDINVVETDCLKLQLSSTTGGITLEKTYPLTDEEAEELTPYTFEVKNICNTTAYYTINLEIMADENRLDSKYIAVDLGSGKTLLSDYLETTPTYKDDNYTAAEARRLVEYGELKGEESATYNLKLWLDGDVTAEEAMSKIFISKISIVATQQAPKPTIANYVKTLAITDTTNLVADDETDDHNIRYIGKDPDNYLCFDKLCKNGKWRVIGVMNNMSISSSTKKYSLVKIIRESSIGKYAWDENNVNDWTTASLNTYLNGDWYTSNLKDYDNLIESVVWKLGGYSSASITTKQFYAYERGTIVYSGRPTEWTGKIALMYPSDYGYATSGGDIGRDTCLTYSLYSWGSYNDCKSNDFLRLGSFDWTLMPYSSYSFFALSVYSSGNVNYDNVPNYSPVRPAFYLKYNTQILSGTGTSTDPWIIGID